MVQSKTCLKKDVLISFPCSLEVREHLATGIIVRAGLCCDRCAQKAVVGDS